MQLTLASILAFAAAALAITVTSPTKADQWDLSTDNKIEWGSVSTDPSTINIILVNMAVNPSVSLTIASNIPVSDGSYDLKNLDSAPTPGSAYQINLVNAHQGGILAQSQQFAITKSSNSQSTAAATGTLLTAASATLSKAASASSPASASGSLASSSASAAASASTSGSASASGASSGANAASKTSHTATPTGAASNVVSNTGMGGLGALVMGALMLFV